VLINCSKRYQKVKCHEDRSTTKIGIEKAIGQTHLIYLKSISEETSCDIYGKAEFLNATGSVKDRTAVSIISEAEKSGTLKPGGTIVEGTGGNTGIALAQLGASKGYKVVLFLPNSIASEKIDYQKRFGATVILQPLVPFTNPENYARKAESYASETNSLFTNQFENLANFLAHYEGTGKEIYNELDGKIDGFVTSAGTGGTIAGISSYLKDQNKDIKCYLVDPVGSVLYNYVNYNKLETTPGNSQVEGIGIGRITANFKQSQLDGAFQCTDKEAVEMAYYLMRNEGLYLGPSAALNVCGAVKLARLLGPGKVIVTILCDGGERYVSKFYNPLWLSENNLAPTRIGKSLDFVL
jgi:cysteine synthase A